MSTREILRQTRIQHSSVFSEVELRLLNILTTPRKLSEAAALLWPGRDPKTPGFLAGCGAIMKRLLADLVICWDTKTHYYLLTIAGRNVLASLAPRPPHDD